MLYDDWDAPYQSALVGALKLIASVALVVLTVGGILLVRGIIFTIFGG